VSKIKINLTEAIEPENTSGGLYLSEAGEYVMRIDSFKEGQSEQKGTPFLEFTFKTIKGQILSERFYTVPTALWKLKRLAVSALKEETSIKDVAFDPETLLDKWVKLNLITERYVNKDGEDKTKLKIQDIGEADKPNEDEEIDKLVDKIGGRKMPDPF